jgi:hypothetical protein
MVNMPGFTAEASVYQPNGHYASRRGRDAPNSSISPAMEKIEVHGCPPGSSFWEEGGDWGCIGDDPFGGGGGGGGGTPPRDGGEAGPFGTGGGGGTGDPAMVDPCPGMLQPNPHYSPNVCKLCTAECDLAHPLEPCEGSKLWCTAINAEAQGERSECYENTCGWRCRRCI